MTRFLAVSDRPESPYRDLSLWLDTVPGTLEPRPTLPGDREVDVAVVGAGFTGLWTAYHLARLDPSLRVAVLERDIAGYGASGRNGGWALCEYSIGPMEWARRWSPESAIRQMRALHDAVDDIGRVSAAEEIDCHYAKGGWINWARSPLQLERLAAAAQARHDLGLTEADLRMVGVDEARAIGNASEVYGGLFRTHVAAIHPARLVRGLADVVERLGVMVYENTAVRSLEPGKVVTERGAVRAEVVVRATEGYTRTLTGHRRVLAPIYSLMVATEPLSEKVWDEIGLAGRPTFSDARNMVIYGQRTADGRLAFGGRGAPYLFGSRIDTATERRRDVHDRIEETLRDLFPAIVDARITHRWGGVMGLPRDWTPSVAFDRSTGLAQGGGFVGDGVATAKLAGHTLAELITGTESERTDLPWVGHTSRNWEPEPLRYLGINGGLWMASSADRAEARTGRGSRRVDLLNRLLGR